MMRKVIVTLLDPKMCLECRFRGLAMVTEKDGTTTQMTHCKRLDCDNWVVASAKDYESITEL